MVSRHRPEPASKCRKKPRAACNTWWYDENGNICTDLENCNNGDLLKLCKQIKGAQYEGNQELFPVNEDGIIQIPADMFVEATISEDGCTATLKLPGTECEEITVVLKAVKDIVFNEDEGTWTVFYSDGTKGVTIGGGTAVVDLEAGTTTQCNPDGTKLVSCNNPVKTVTGPRVDNEDPQNPVVENEWSENIIVDLTSEFPAYPAGPTEPGTCSKVLDQNGHLIGVVDDQGYHPIVHPDQEQEWSENISVDTTVESPVYPTEPTEPDTCSKVLDQSGNLIGIVDTDGYHPIVHPDDTLEWSENISVDTESDLPTYPAQATVEGTCAKVLDQDGNLIGIVDDDGYHPIPSYPDEWSETITVQTSSATPNYPTEATVPGTCAKVLDENGNLIGLVDDDGYYPIPREWSENIMVTTGEEPPTDPTVTGTCAKVLDDASNLIGIVDADGYHPIVHPELTDAAGDPVPENPDGTLCVTPGTVDCDGEAIKKGDTLVRKVLSPDGTEWPTDGQGALIAQCVCASIALVKSAIPGPYEEGDEVVYTFAVVNNGNLDLTNVEITDDKITVNGGPIDLAIGESDNDTFTGTYIYTAEDVAAGGCSNVAVVTAVDTQGNVVTSMDDAQVFNEAPPEQPEIMLTKVITSGDGPYFEGNEIEYSFVVSNTGDVPLSNVVVTDSILTVVGGPVSIAVGDSDSTSFTGTYTVTADDVAASQVVNTAATEGTSPQGAVVTAEASATAPTAEVQKECGTLPEREAVPFVDSTSNPILSQDGNMYNLNSVTEHRTQGGVLLATITQTVNFVVGNFVYPKDPIGVAPDTNIFFMRDGLPRSGFANRNSVQGGGQPPGQGIVNEIAMQFDITDEIGPEGLAIQGCQGTARSEIHVIDADGGSQIKGMSRIWDELSQPFGGSPTPPGTEAPPGTWTFTGQSNAYADWDADLHDEDTVSLTYSQASGDDMLTWSQIYWTPAVCFTRDADGNINYAETIDGPLPESEWGDIIPN